MSRGRLRMCCRAVVKVFCQGQLSGRRRVDSTGRSNTGLLKRV